MELPGLATEQAKEQNSNATEEIENLVSVVYQNGQYYLFHNQSVEEDYSFKNHLKMAWLVVRYSQDWINPNDENVYYCEKGDIIKFGRVRFKIRSLVIELDQQLEEIDDSKAEINTQPINILQNLNRNDDTLTLDNDNIQGLENRSQINMNEFMS